MQLVYMTPSVLSAAEAGVSLLLWKQKVQDIWGVSTVAWGPRLQVTAQHVLGLWLKVQ